MPRSPQEIFARRLSVACDHHPSAPADHGRQAWLRRQLEQHGVSVSATAVNNWFNGYTCASSQLAAKLARILGVSQAWLTGLEGTDGIPANRDAGASSAAKGASEGGTFDFNIPLRTNLIIQIRGVPFDMTAAEARKVANVLVALVQAEA